MTTAAYGNNNWGFDFFFPRPTQDSELLQQLGFLPGLKEFLMLRQVHALEHATVWILSGQDQAANDYLLGSNFRLRDNETLGGLSTDQGFYLYGEIDLVHLKQSVRLALTRLKKGEWNLALHPRCGTNVSVATMLTAGMILTTYAFLPRDPIGQLLGLGLVTTVAASLAPEIGMSVQKYVTTAIPFNLKIKEITKTKDQAGRPAYFVHLQWQNQ